MAPASGVGTGAETEQSTLLAALVGAVITVVTSVVPLSPIVGGAVAAYLRRGGRREGVRVGAISGVLAAIPIVLILGLVFGGLSLVTIVDGEVAGFVLFVGLLAITTVIVVGLVAGLSALGGYLAAVLLEREAGAETGTGNGTGTASDRHGADGEREAPPRRDDADVTDPTTDADVATGVEETTDVRTV
jgi:hypothetical protein